MQQNHSARRGITLIEVLTTILIVGILLSIVLVAVMRGRAKARQVSCVSNLRQIGMAMNQYHDVHSMFPGTNAPWVWGTQGVFGRGWSFHASLLPFVEQKNLYDRIDFGESPYFEMNYKALNNPIAIYLCPADVNDGSAGTNYVVNFGTWIYRDGRLREGAFDGIFNPQTNRALRRGMVRDGLSQTVAFSETVRGRDRNRLGSVFDSPEVRQVGWFGKEDEFRRACEAMDPSRADHIPTRHTKGDKWYSSTLPNTAYNHVMRPNQNSCEWGDTILSAGIAATSNHPRGVNAAMVDGSARFFSAEIDASTWWAIGSIAGREVVEF